MTSRVKIGPEPSRSPAPTCARSPVVLNHLVKKSETTSSRLNIASPRVRSWDEKHQAELIAWKSPHVTEVHNHLAVTPREP